MKTVENLTVCRGRINMTPLALLSVIYVNEAVEVKLQMHFDQVPSKLDVICRGDVVALAIQLRLIKFSF